MPNPECKSFTTWRGVSAHRSRQKLMEASRPSFVSRHNIYVTPELRDLLQPSGSRSAWRAGGGWMGQCRTLLCVRRCLLGGRPGHRPRAAPEIG